MRPVIGITTTLADRNTLKFSLPQSYVNAVWEAGGLPVLLPCTRQTDIDTIIDTIDGLLLPGGDDVDPAFYGEEPARALGEVDPLADRFEIDLCQAWLKTQRPLVGICRGMQLINVAFGGTLFQDISEATGSTLQHMQKAPSYHGMHPIDIVPGSRLHKIFGKEKARVNTFHHQSVKDVAPGLTVTAKTSDGIIEAVEGRGDAFVLAVQWHPELMTEDPHRAALFDTFISAVRAGLIR